MAKTDRIQVRIDSELKMKAAALFDELDMNLSDAVTLFIKESVSKGRIPFSVKTMKKSNVTRKSCRTSQ